MFSLLTTTDRYSCDLWSFYIVLTVLPKPAEMNQRITEASRKWANLWCRDLGEFLCECERTDRMIGSLHLEKHDTGFNVEALRWPFFSWAVYTAAYHVHRLHVADTDLVSKLNGKLGISCPFQVAASWIPLPYRWYVRARSKPLRKRINEKDAQR